jgi:hypothetical protein
MRGLLLAMMERRIAYAAGSMPDTTAAFVDAARYVDPVNVYVAYARRRAGAFSKGS